MPRSAASHLGLHYLPMSQIWDASLIWVNANSADAYQMPSSVTSDLGLHSFTEPEDHTYRSCIAHLSTEETLKSAVTEEKNLK